MRIILWNCNNGIGKKIQIDYFKSFKPDVAIIPELKQKNIEALAPDNSVWVTNNHANTSPKGLGVLSFNGYKIDELPRDDEMEIFIPLRVRKNDFSFNLLAVWSFYSACKQGRFRNLRGPDCLEFSALEYYKGFFTDPSLIVGDWNLGPTFSQKGFLKILDILKVNGIMSLYHEHHKLPPTDSKHSTFRSSRKRLHHIDHIFGSAFFFQGNMLALEIDDFQNVILSDHAPMVLDLKIEP